MPTFEYGDMKTNIHAIRQKSIAVWGNKQPSTDTDFGYYSPPPGWVILSNRVHVLSDNNGSYSVMTAAGGSNFESRTKLEQAYNDAIDAAVSVGDFTASASFTNERDQLLTSYDYYSASHNTIKLTTQATRSGNPVTSRNRGWLEVSLYVDLMYICEPNCAGKISSNLMSRIQRPIINPKGDYGTAAFSLVNLGLGELDMPTSR